MRHALPTRPLSLLLALSALLPAARAALPACGEEREAVDCCCAGAQDAPAPPATQLAGECGCCAEPAAPAPAPRAPAPLPSPEAFAPATPPAALGALPAREALPAVRHAAAPAREAGTALLRRLCVNLI
jgi:hypothetical protein